LKFKNISTNVGECKEMNLKHSQHYQKYCPFQPYVQLLVQLVFKSIKFMITLVIALHVTKSHARTFIGVIKFWHVPICSCKCNYLLWLLYMHFGWKGGWKVHSCQSYFITSNDKQVFTNAICPIEFTCQFLISCVVIHYY
jgi:hypothetical protein